MIGSSSRRQHGLHGFDDMPLTTLIMRRATISGRDWFLPLRGIAVPVYRVGPLGLPSPALRRFSTYEILSLEKRSDKIYHWRCLITHALHKGQHWDVTAPGAVSLFFFSFSFLACGLASFADLAMAAWHDQPTPMTFRLGEITDKIGGSSFWGFWDRFDWPSADWGKLSCVCKRTLGNETWRYFFAFSAGGGVWM
ncbi:hypothetical protein CDEST_06604 [Colletotrichum destructivum]|uniref:Uncharacterized protein n=1 Tax=Colletotrichum destructivum TaxID=34406 RepID=A0AAX4IE87_9PEZI|nr:hypothetical protein CDEST_06604 [Colletotrichum destructivum]